MIRNTRWLRLPGDCRCDEQPVNFGQKQTKTSEVKAERFLKKKASTVSVLEMKAPGDQSREPFHTISLNPAKVTKNCQETTQGSQKV